MSRIRRIAVIGTALAIALSACGDDSAETTGAPPPTATLSPAGEAGKVVFEDNCAVCHGEDLTGDIGPALHPGSEAAGKPVAALESQIREGGNGMPAWDGLLEESELTGVLAYLTEMQGR